MRIFWYYSLLVCCILSSEYSFACEWAVQSRILPIGVIDNEIIALNLRMKRTWQAPDSAASDRWYWNGEASLVSFTISNLKITKKHFSAPFSWGHTNFKKSVTELYLTTLKIAEKFPNIELLFPDKMEMYYFKEKPQFALKIDDGDSTAYILDNSLPGSKTYLPNWEYTDTNSILYYPTAKSAEEMLEIYELSRRPSLSNITGSVRSFKIGSHKLIIVHVGIGDLEGFEDGEDLPLFGSPPAFDNLTNCAYEEPVLWHGIGQDIPIWLN